MHREALRLEYAHQTAFESLLWAAALFAITLSGFHPIPHVGNASLILEDVDPAAAERVKEVIVGAERAANLTRQLLAYSGKGQFIVRDLDVSEAVNEISGLVQFSIPKNIQLAVAVEKRLPNVRMDPSQLQQILMNLLINAGEAFDDASPGRVTVTASTAEVETAFTDAVGEVVDPGRYVCVEVADNGRGIDSDARSRIFDPFFTTKFTGRGLGLAAVAGIVRSQKGGISVDSAAGQGSTFCVFLPVSERYARGFGEQAGTTGERGTVLVVDDEASVRDFIGAVLRRQKYRVVPASDGREAAQRIADGAAEFRDTSSAPLSYASLRDATLEVSGGRLSPIIKRFYINYIPRECFDTGKLTESFIGGGLCGDAILLPCFPSEPWPRNHGA
jgi:CheY-like chemotaxis protein